VSEQFLNSTSAHIRLFSAIHSLSAGKKTELDRESGSQRDKNQVRHED